MTGGRPAMYVRRHAQATQYPLDRLGNCTVTESKPRQVSVLLVEDETRIRMMIAGMVNCHTVVAEAGNMTQALILRERRISKLQFQIIMGVAKGSGQ